jgi:hypothetical protein
MVSTGIPSKVDPIAASEERRIGRLSQTALEMSPAPDRMTPGLGGRDGVADSKIPVGNHPQTCASAPAPRPSRSRSV